MPLDNDLLPTLAHELCHAREIAGAPEVRDETSLRKFYDRFDGGMRVGGRLMLDSARAHEVASQVLNEPRRPR